MGKGSPKAFASLFTPALFRRLPDTVDQPLAEAIRRVGHDLRLPVATPGLVVVEEAYDAMLKTVRNEYVFRNESLRNLRGAYPYAHEVQVGRSIADLMRFGRSIEIFEFKTSRDSPRRLDTQFRDYLSVSRDVNLVCERGAAPLYVEAVTGLPVSLWEMGPRGGMRRLLRLEAEYPRLERRALIGLLRRGELVSLAREAGLPEHLIESTSLFAMLQQELEAWDSDRVSRAVAARLRRRHRAPLSHRPLLAIESMLSWTPDEGRKALRNLETWSS